MRTAMNGKGLLFFPTPYPDEILYSVLCRYWIRAGRPSPRSVMEDFYGARRDSNILTPRYLGRIASLLPASSGMNVEFFLKNATVFPCFQPFLTQKRAEAYREYLSNSLPDSKSLYFSLGMGKLRYPRTNYLRFCSECWKEDVEKYGEPYWRRLHQLPGVMVCPVHHEPFMATTITTRAAGKSFYPAEERLISQSQACGVYSDGTMEKLALIASDSAWLLQNGMDCGSYEQIHAKYVQYSRSQGFDSLTGHIRAKKIRNAVQDSFGAELLGLLDA
ncbi:MAG: TniQ family protein, partial [Oscillospiraceae bacterium]|nr:TniQ family protein [Oscillospiraceae bacterium]